MNIQELKADDGNIERVDPQQETMEPYGTRCLRIAQQIGADAETIQYYTELASIEDGILAEGIAIFDTRTKIHEGDGVFRDKTDADIEAEVRTMMHYADLSQSNPDLLNFSSEHSLRS